MAEITEIMIDGEKVGEAHARKPHEIKIGISLDGIKEFQAELEKTKIALTEFGELCMRMGVKRRWADRLLGYFVKSIVHK